MGKFKARFVVIPLAVIIAAGGIFGGIQYKQSKNIVKVAEVSGGDSIVGDYGSEVNDLKFYGRLEKGSVVNVKVNNQLKIKSINVKKGDTIKKGDVLISYETHSIEDAVEDAKLQVTTLANNITIADNELNVLKRLQPSENAPQIIIEEPEEEEPDTDSSETPAQPETPASKYEKLITEKTIPLGGSGTAEDPLVYIAGVETSVSKEALTLLASVEPPLSAVCYVCDENDNQLFARYIDGSKIDPETVEDFPLADGVTVTPDGMISFDGGSVDFATFVTAVSTGMPSVSQNQDFGDFSMFFPEDVEEPAPQTVDPTQNVSAEITLETHNYVFSAQEIKDMIKEKEKEKAALELQKKQAELDVRKSEKLSQTGGEIASIDGTVTFVAKDMNHLSDSGAYITITNDSGLSVTATVGEFSRDELFVGMQAEIINYETGVTTNGSITAMSDTPVDDSYYSTSAATDMESMYKFTVTLENDLEISEDSEVQITLVKEAEVQGLYLLEPLVRTDAGRYYVMVDNNGYLEKRYIKVGNSTMGMYEVLEGLSKEDLIAFPYGKAVEGAATRKTTFEDMYYNFGILY